MHAIVPTQCVARLKPLLVENCVCLLSTFHVVTNMSEFMSTSRKHRIILQPTTEVMATTSSIRQEYDLLVVDSKDILRRRFGYSFVVD